MGLRYAPGRDGPLAGPVSVRGAAEAVSIRARAADFARGIVDTGHLVFFAAASAWCLFAAHAALGARRWR